MIKVHVEYNPNQDTYDFYVKDESGYNDELTFYPTMNHLCNPELRDELITWDRYTPSGISEPTLRLTPRVGKELLREIADAAYMHGATERRIKSEAVIGELRDQIDYLRRLVRYLTKGGGE